MSVCGLPGSLSWTLRVPVRAPVAVGVKLTVIIQVPPLAATEAQPEDGDAVKSCLSAPVIDTAETEAAVVGFWLVRVTVAVAVLPTVTVPKLTGEGERVT